MKAALQDHTESKHGKERKIPIHIRFVPRDVWIRMHVDVRSTIGAIKDAALEKVDMPPMDPTIFPDFYENARGAMARPAYRSLEAKTFPKAFIARRPKGTLVEVLESDRRKKGSNQSMNAALPPISPSKLRARRKNMAEVSKQVLGGDAGEGGMGSLGSVGALRAGRVAQQRSNDSLSGGDAAAARRTNSSRVISSPSASSTSSRFINVKVARSPTSRASMVSLSAAVKAVQKTTSTKDLQREAAEASGAETYSEYLSAGLPGNIEAKRREEEAMNSLQRAGSTSSASFSPHRAHFKPIGRSKVTTSSSGSRSIASSINDPVNATEPTDIDLDDSSSDDDNESEPDTGIDKVVPSAKNLMSSESDLSSASHLERQSSLPASPTAAKAVLKDRTGGVAAPHRNKATASASIGTTERGRSGTIVGGPDVRRGKLPVDMVRAYSDQSAQSGTYATKSSPSKVDAPSSAVSRRSQEMTGKPLQGLPMSRMNNWTDNRLAGIRMDEISSWRSAQHAMSQHFLAYSFSNGHMLEDWRTVAAFRIRPFELIEIHYANPADRVFLPREHMRVDDTLMRSSSATLIDSHLDVEKVDPYTEQRSEAWCYVFKPGSGPGKAQRAGLGVWKLRFVVVRDQHMYICRKKPSRSAMNHLHDAEVWPLDMLDSVFTERADGGTRPALPSMQGECRDVLTLTVATAVLPDASTYSETLASAVSPTYHASLSIRFISQADCRAFYNTLARALHCATAASEGGKSAWVNEWRKKVVTRATIAGMGGVVLPGKQGRGKGRNALARTRLRPPGVSRVFDDVDRWSSQSENEEHDKVRPTNKFNYSDPYRKAEADAATLDPSYDFVPLVKTVSLQSSLAPGSPKMARSSLSPADEDEERRDDDRKKIVSTTTTTTTTSTETPQGSPAVSHIDGSSSAVKKAERRLRGFSIARAARRAVTPVDVSPKTSTAPGIAAEPPQPAPQQHKGEQASTMGRSTRRKTLTQLEVSKQAPMSRSNPNSPRSRATFYYLDDRPATASTTPPRTPVRTSSQAFGQQGPPTASSTSHGNGGDTSRVETSPSSSKGARQRSHTVSQASPPPSSIPSSSPSFIRRSVGSKQAVFASPSSSSTANCSTGGNTSVPLFHWPFRGASNRASIAAKSNSNK